MSMRTVKVLHSSSGARILPTSMSWRPQATSIPLSPESGARYAIKHCSLKGVIMKVLTCISSEVAGAWPPWSNLLSFDLFARYRKSILALHARWRVDSFGHPGLLRYYQQIQHLASFQVGGALVVQAAFVVSC